ncbi:DNA glycosylase [Quillaja saponaria]|uniref:DNA-(apurinic or apyrimidinic site) lyase n=1 Tax=Quillaja saponaria TaxID=32244 RepID=A0AAD7KME1_QUISA|nr:DNA glycosylase [Quillaja saponaria]
MNSKEMGINCLEEEEIETQPCDHSKEDDEDEGRRTSTLPWCELELPLGEAAETFRLDKAVCSHGLFMMAPNHWDPISKTLTRPLRLSLVDDDYSSFSSAGSVLVTISQPPEHPNLLNVRVHGTKSLSSLQQHALLAQVSRMLRLSETEERAVKEFQKMYNMFNYGDNEDERNFSGRVFRSPTLFEDMVKCILLCNCQWSRTLSMAQSLCELKLEMHCHSSHFPVAKVVSTVADSPKSETDDFIPKTSAEKESRRDIKDCKSSQTAEDCIADSCLQFSHRRGCYASGQIGNFPSPRELAKFDENFLAERCKLGYRANRILKLAQEIVQGGVQLRHLEEVSNDSGLSSYNKLADQLKEIDGFGPFTCANVLMCMGYYNVIPTDTETIRHLAQFHAKKSTTRTVHRDVEKIYGNYAPYQFLAYC